MLLPTLEDLVYLPLWLLIIQDRQRGFLTLSWQWIARILPKEVRGEHVVLIIAIRQP